MLVVNAFQEIGEKGDALIEVHKQLKKSTMINGKNTYLKKALVECFKEWNMVPLCGIVPMV